MRARRFLQALALAASLSLVAVACGDAEQAQPREASFTLRVGNLLPFTGDLAPFGRPADEAAKLAAQLIDESLGELGLSERFRVQIAGSEDTQTQSTAAVEAATKLVQTDNVHMINGAMASANTIPVAESVTVPNNVVQISPASTSPAITALEDEGFVWRTAPSDALQGRVLARAVGDAFGKDATINTGTRNDAYGVALIGQFEKAWKDAGGTIGEQVRWNPNAATFESEAQQLVRGNPDGWVIIDFPETFAKVGPALVRTGRWDPAKTFTADGLRSDTLPGDAGRRATEGMRGTAPSSEKSPAGDAFDKTWKQRVKVSRQTFDAHSFDAVMLTFLAALRAGSSEPERIKERLQAVSAPPGDSVTFENLDDAIRMILDGRDVNYEGAAGPIDFNDDGDPTASNYEVWQFENGRLRTLRVLEFDVEEGA